MDYKEILNETRAVFSRHRGRIFRKVDPRDLVLPTNSRDEMVVRVGADQKQLLKSGKVVWAALIQANFQMYVKRVHSRGGEVLCSLDPHFDAHPRELQAIASTLFSFKGKEKVPRVLQRIVADIRN